MCKPRIGGVNYIELVSYWRMKLTPKKEGRSVCVCVHTCAHLCMYVCEKENKSRSHLLNSWIKAKFLLKLYFLSQKCLSVSLPLSLSHPHYHHDALSEVFTTEVLLFKRSVQNLHNVILANLVSIIIKLHDSNCFSI